MSTERTTERGSVDGPVDERADEPSGTTVTATSSDGADVDDGPGGPLFWVSAALGAAVVVFAGYKLWDYSSTPSRGSIIRFFLGGGIAHDALWAPAAVVVGAVTLLVLPHWARVPVRLGLAFTALMVLISWPLVRPYGRRANIPSFLPLDYGRNLAILLALIWAVVIVALVTRAVQRRQA